MYSKLGFDIQKMKLGMEVFGPSPYLQHSNWFFEEGKIGKWTQEENKKFENALAVYDRDTSDRWQKVANMIPGKTVDDVIRHYKDLEADVSHIEAGLIPPPGYSTTFTLEWVNRRDLDRFRSAYTVGGKRSAARPDQERKKGIPWTEEEHRLFLMGLKKYGKGDWRNISRNFVTSRTPTQVASHAQKYFIRQCSGNKDKRRSSIHDITTVNLTDTRSPSPSQSTAGSVKACPPGAPKTLQYSSNQLSEGATVFSPTSSQMHGNLFMNPPYGTSYGMKLQPQNFLKSTLCESQIVPPDTIYPLRSSRQHHLRG